MTCSCFNIKFNIIRFNSITHQEHSLSFIREQLLQHLTLELPLKAAILNHKVRLLLLFQLYLIKYSSDLVTAFLEDTNTC